MPVSFLYPAAVKAVHQKAAVGHIKAHAHDAPERDIAGAVIFNNAAARYNVGFGKHRVIKRQLRVPVALAQAYVRFDNTTEPELVDACIFELNALQSRYNYLLRLVKESGGIAASKIYSEGAATWV